MPAPVGKTPRGGIGGAVPLKIRERVDEIAKQRGVSRSVILADALSAYVAKCDAAAKRREQT
jgi:predicted transcriptional regulator